MPKITSITPNGQWQEFYKLELRFDNGDFGTAFAKSETPSYKVGDEVEYTKNEKGTVKIQLGHPQHRRQTMTALYLLFARWR